MSAGTKSKCLKQQYVNLKAVLEITGHHSLARSSTRIHAGSRTTHDDCDRHRLDDSLPQTGMGRFARVDGRVRHHPPTSSLAQSRPGPCCCGLLRSARIAPWRARANRRKTSLPSPRRRARISANAQNAQRRAHITANSMACQYQTRSSRIPQGCIRRGLYVRASHSRL